MKTKKQKIEIPEGYEIDAIDKSSGELTFKEKPNPTDITDHIKTVDDALLALGEIDEEVIIYRKLLTIFDPSCHIVNYQLAVVLTRAINEEWVPDWNDPNQPKYILYFTMGGSVGFRFNDCDGWSTRSGVGSRLCFKEARLGEYLAAQFKDVFNNFMLIHNTEKA